jgi:arylsulfatase A-like enzyme
MKFRFTTLAGLLLALGCGPSPSPEAAAPVRLIAEGRSVAAAPFGEVPGAGAAELPEASEIGAAGNPGRVGRIVMATVDRGADGRVALVAPVGTPYRADLSVPVGDPVLAVALGYPVETTPSGLALRFRVRVAPAGEPGDGVEVLDETITTAADGLWSDREVALDDWAGHDVRLELLAEAPPGSPPSPPLMAGWAAPEVVTRAREPEGWNLLLVVLDTLRADHVGSYGYDRPTTPYLDGLAERSARFATAVSQSSWTRPSIGSLLCGLYPESRGGLTSPPLAQVLWENGYRTRAFTGGAQLAFRFGFSRGFEQHAILDWVRSIDTVVDAFEASRARSHFVFLHTYEIHDPYEHSELAAGLGPGRVGEVFRRTTWERLKDGLTESEREYVKALYDSGIRFTDERLGLLLERLEERHLLDRTLVVVTADHGEELWDNGLWGHGRAMLEHQSRVPLIVHLPPTMQDALGLPRGASVIRQQVRLVDLYPTLLDLLGVPLDHEVQGRSLRPLLAGERMPPANAFSESVYWGPVEVKALRGERFKYLRGIPKKPGDPEHEGWEVVFDLESDPGETTDVKNAHERVLRRLAAEVDFILRGGATPQEDAVPEDLDPELEKQLRALGYIQ